MSISMSVPATGSLASSVVGLGARDDLSHDHGLQHCHDWAREGSAGRSPGPLAADTAAWPTPSSTMHDDVLYGMG